MFAEAYAIWVFGHLIFEEIRLYLGAFWSKHGFSCATSIEEAKEFHEIMWPMVRSAMERRHGLYAAVVLLCVLSRGPLSFRTYTHQGGFVNAIAGGNIQDAWTELTYYSVYLATQTLISMVQDVLWRTLATRLDRHIEKALFGHLMILSYSFHQDKTKTTRGTLYRVRAISSTLETIAISIIPTSISLWSACGYIHKLNMDMTLVVILVLYLWIILKISVGGNRSRDGYFQNEIQRKQNASDAINHWVTVRIFGGQQYEIDSYAAALRDPPYQDRYILRMSRSIILALGFYIIFSRFAAESSNVADFTTLHSYCLEMRDNLESLIRYPTMLSSSYHLIHPLFKLFRMEPSMDSPDAKDITIARGEIVFDKVSFGYGEIRVLSEISFTIPAGSTVAFVGVTGCGKTTIFELMLGLKTPCSGSITIDGIDIRTYKRANIQAAIACAPQDTQLFENRSIMDNIRYAQMKATDQDVYDACQAVQIHDQIKSFENGFNTVVGSRRCSGGETQRIGLARLVVQSAAKVWLLDEPTSNCDVRTESKILRSVKSLARGRTTIFIAHRLSTIQDVDTIFLIEDGKLVEQGSHNQLRQKRGKYYELTALSMLGDNPISVEGETPNA